MMTKVMIWKLGRWIEVECEVIKSSSTILVVEHGKTSLRFLKSSGRLYGSSKSFNRLLPYIRHQQLQQTLKELGE